MGTASSPGQTTGEGRTLSLCVGGMGGGGDGGIG